MERGPPRRQSIPYKNRPSISRRQLPPSAVWDRSGWVTWWSKSGERGRSLTPPPPPLCTANSPRKTKTIILPSAGTGSPDRSGVCAWWKVGRQRRLSYRQQELALQTDLVCVHGEKWGDKDDYLTVSRNWLSRQIWCVCMVKSGETKTIILPSAGTGSPDRSGVCAWWKVGRQRQTGGGDWQGGTGRGTSTEGLKETRGRQTERG